jgi:tRNA(fMet)-specific endonuclease VapC
MQFLLDTNAVISLVGQKSRPLVDRILACREGEIGLSSIVVHELYFGAYKSQKVAYNLETLRLLLKDFMIVEFNQEDARMSGEIRSALAAKGTPIGSYDVLIAGQAKARDLTLVTNNIGEFERVVGLRCDYSPVGNIGDIWRPEE